MIAHDKINPDFWDCVSLGEVARGAIVKCGRCKKENRYAETPTAEHMKASEVYHFKPILWSILEGKIIVAGCACMADVRWEEEVWRNRARLTRLNRYIVKRLRRESRDIFSNEESMLSFMQLCEMLPGDAENREGK